MLEAIPPEETNRSAQRVGVAIRAAVHFMLEAIEQEAENDTSIDVRGLMRDTTRIKFVKPTAPTVNNLMGQFGVLFVQVIPAEQHSLLWMILEQGYHVVPNDHLSEWKSVILAAHAEALAEVMESLDEQDEPEPTAPAPVSDGEEV
jgi:hypothetical protein